MVGSTKQTLAGEGGRALKVRAQPKASQTTVTKQSSVRKRLLDAAYEKMSADGFEPSGVADIIKASGVGVGSFYHHFSCKEDLARAAFAYRVEEFGLEFENVVTTAPDIAAATCFAYRRLIQRAENNQSWGSFILHLEPHFGMFDGLMRPHARIALKTAIERGEFDVVDLEGAVTVLHSMVLATMQAMLRGDLSRRCAHRSLLYVLRMFQVPEERSQELSRMSMAALHRIVGSVSPAE